MSRSSLRDLLHSARRDSDPRGTDGDAAEDRTVAPHDPAVPPVVALLNAHRKTQVAERLRAAYIWIEDDFVFPTEARQPMDPRNVLRALHTAADRLGLAGVSVHTLRHLAASAMLNGGQGIKTVSAMLGHSSIAITGDIYAHVSDDAAQAAADALDRAMGLW